MKLVLTSTLVVMGLPMALAAQQTPPTAPPPEPDPVVELIVLRETFTYPAFQRRNPFVSLNSASAAGPRFDQMRLQGIIFSEDDPGLRVASLSAGAVAAPQLGGVQAEQGAPAPSARLRQGERWGNVRVVQIFRDYIVVDVTEFGLNERYEMRIQARGQGGS